MRSAKPLEGQLSLVIDLLEPEPELESEPAQAPQPEPEPEHQPGRRQAFEQSPPAPRMGDGAEPAGDERIDVSGSGTGTDAWRAILDFERTWSGPLSAKQRSIRERFGVGSARYHQLLDRALERPDALVYDPALVGRLRRLREARRRKRFAARLDVDPPVGPRGGGA